MNIVSEKIEARREDRDLIEYFMGYAELFLGTYLRWNDVMPVCQKIKVEFDKHMEKNKPSDENIGMITWTTELVEPYFKITTAVKDFDLSKTYNAIIDFLKKIKDKSNA